MATIKFADAAANPDLLAAFNPSSDILLFSDSSAADIKLSGDDSSTTFTVGNDSVTIDVAIKAIASGTEGFVRFIDSSVLMIGDGTAATVADDLANQHEEDATDGNDQLIGLGGNDTLNGGLGDDKIYGNSGDDVIGDGVRLGFPSSLEKELLAGNDTIYAGQGDDFINYNNVSDGQLLAYGNLGDDVIYGSNGASLYYGGQGDDTIFGGTANDVVYGNADNDYIIDQGGDNTLFGGQGDDTIAVQERDSGNSVAYGNLGDDKLQAGAGGDTLFGGQGNDTIYNSTGDDLLFGNAGDDMIIIAGNLFPRFPVLDTIESASVTVWGGEGHDTLETGDLFESAVLFKDFNGAEDVVSMQYATALDIAQNAYGGAITDTDNRGNLFKAAAIILQSDDGAVTLAGAAGQTLDGDNLKLSDGSVFVYNVGGAAGEFDGSDTFDFMVAGDNGDTLTAGDGVDTLIGGDGGDLFVMGAYADGDVLQGGLGDDTITATVDGETMFVTNTNSIEHIVFSWGSGTGTATIELTQDQDITADASSLTVGQDVEFYVEHVYGNTFVTTGTGDDTLYGSNNSEHSDSVNTGDGDDYIDAENGNDVINAGAGQDYVIGGGGADTMTGGGGADLFVFNSSSSGFTLTTVDHITDFNAAEDKIDFSISPAAVFDERLVDLSASADLATAAANAYAAATGVDAEDVVLFSFGGHTYVYLNDSTSGFSTSTDLLVDITGYTGTFTVSSVYGEV